MLSRSHFYREHLISLLSNGSCVKMICRSGTLALITHTQTHTECILQQWSRSNNYYISIGAIGYNGKQLLHRELGALTRTWIFSLLNFITLRRNRCPNVRGTYQCQPLVMWIILYPITFTQTVHLLDLLLFWKQWWGTTLCLFLCFPSRLIKCCVLLQTSALLSSWNWWACCRRRDSPQSWSQSTHSIARSWCSPFPRRLLKDGMKCALMDDSSVWIQVCISIFNLFLITDCPHLPSAALTCFFFVFF